MKDFPRWFSKKGQLDGLAHKPPFVSIGDIWWVSLGANVGSEIDGKSEVFSRPVIVYKKLSHGFYLVIPTSTKLKEGTWHVPYKHKDVSCIACLHQIRTIDYRRILSKIGTLDDSDMERVKTGFLQLYN